MSKIYRFRNLLTRNILLIAAICFGVLLPFLIALSSGNLAIPHNDAWSHSRIAKTFADTGEFELLGWNRSALVGQIVILGPLASSLIAQHSFVAILAAVFLLSVYLLLRPTIGSNYAGFSVLVISIWPGFALLTTSYMADIPMLAAIFLSLLIAKSSFERDSRLLFIVALTIGFWGTTIREQAIAAPVAIVITWIWKYRKSINMGRLLVFGSSLIFLASFIAFEFWRLSLPNNDPPQFGLRPNAVLVAFGGIVRGWFNLSLITGLAALLVLDLKRSGFRSQVATAVTIALGFAALVYSKIENFFLPNYLSQKGSYADVLPPTKEIFSDNLWLVLILLSIFLGGVVIATLSTSRLNEIPLLTTFTFLTFIGTIYQFLTFQGVFDRYFLAFAPWILLAIFNPKHSSNLLGLEKFRLLRTAIPFLAVSILTTLLALNSWAFDQTRWSTAQRLVDQGISAQTVNAGLEWQGWHSETGVINTQRYPSWGFDYLFNQESCFVLTTTTLDQSSSEIPVDSWNIVETVQYKNFLYFGQSQLYVYQTNFPDCD